ncbi:MAG: UDP-N-acetylmuramoylalanyl-D-glutamyl-2, 6-diaminopimelate--D-alanyl-D-alanine ligase, partial [Caulobacteraceae bacterium]|nr:UDP-N-acetylmuramoylalanyl-D-glutamyl-2, 6-diaminopimelate--D-alanyl-D-alanine ligase [Caulobacteraceae bacterium]
SLAVLAAVLALGADVDAAAAGFASLPALKGRGAAERVAWGTGQITVVDDSYNASPVSMAGALRALGDRDIPGRRMAALTDMLELGPDGPQRHAALVEDLEAGRIDLLFCAGPLMRRLWDATPAGRRGAYARSAPDLASEIRAALRPGDVILVKGSNASGARAIVEALTARADRTEAAA